MWCRVLDTTLMTSARAAYAVFGLTYGAPKCEVKAAYRSLVLQWHPDHNGASAESTLMTQVLNNAREVLLLSGEADALWRLEDDLCQQREEHLWHEREMVCIRREREEARVRREREAEGARVRHEREMERIRREREEARVRREREEEESRVRHEREMERVRCEREAEEARVWHEEDRLRQAELNKMEAERVARGVPRVRLTSTARAAYIEGLFQRHRKERARCAAASSGPQKAPRHVARRAPQ
jgi:curved DNA-binding protein CbpA